MASASRSVEIVEVAPRDGFQAIGPLIPTSAKLDFIRQLAAAGLSRIEVGSFVSPRAIPQLADTPLVLAGCADMVALRPQVLVAGARRGREAAEAGARCLVFVLSVSEAHNRSNVRRDPIESVNEYEALLGALPAETGIRVDIATAFDCPFAGRITGEATLALVERIVGLRPDAEICLCDTTGRAVPDQVERLFTDCVARFPSTTRWAFHGHDTYGLGLANVSAAFRAGIRVFDASTGGIGGCPYAPGATGNVATEDLAWMFTRAGIGTSVDVERLLPVAEWAAGIPGALPGGRARLALAASLQRRREQGAQQ